MHAGMPEVSIREASKRYEFARDRPEIKVLLKAHVNSWAKDLPSGATSGDLFSEAHETVWKLCRRQDPQADLKSFARYLNVAVPHVLSVFVLRMRLRRSHEVPEELAEECVSLKNLGNDPESLCIVRDIMEKFEIEVVSQENSVLLKVFITEMYQTKDAAKLEAEYLRKCGWNRVAKLPVVVKKELAGIGSVTTYRKAKKQLASILRKLID